MSAQAQPQLGKLCSVFRLYKNNLAQNFYKRWRTFVTARENEIALVVGILAPPDFNNPIFLGPTRFLCGPRHGKSDIRSWGLPLGQFGDPRADSNSKWHRMSIWLSLQNKKTETTVKLRWLKAVIDDDFFPLANGVFFFFFRCFYPQR